MRSRRRPATWRILLGALPAAAVLIGLAWQARTEAALARCVERLLAGETRVARAALATADASPFRRAAIPGATLLVDALEGRPAAPVAPEALAGFPLEALMRGALWRGDPSATGSLARALEASGWAGAAPYRAAAALERGDTGAAAGAIEALPAGGREHPVARRVAWALERRDAATLVFDREGRPLGWLDSQRELRLEPDVEPDLVPEAVRAALRDAPPGPGLRLSVDLDLAALARNALGGERGTVVLLEPATGAVLAAVSDGRTLQQLATPALEQMREPASIAKLITTAAALRQGLDPDAEIAHMSCGGVKAYPSGMLWCPWGGGPLSGLREALAVSCNVAFAELGALAGRRALVEEYRRWGYSGPDEEPRPGGARIVQPDGDARQLGDLAVGLEVTETTPLHAARMAALFADGGAMAEPRFVVADDGRLGFTPQPLPRPEPVPVLPAEWLPLLVDAMSAVAAPGGTAAGLAPPGFPVAMKTGTAALPGQGYHVNYVGVGPLPDPRIAFCVRVTHQRNSRRVRQAARRVAGALLRGLAARADALGPSHRADPLRPPAPRD